MVALKRPQRTGLPRKRRFPHLGYATAESGFNLREQRKRSDYNSASAFIHANRANGRGHFATPKPAS